MAKPYGIKVSEQAFMDFKKIQNELAKIDTDFLVGKTPHSAYVKQRQKSRAKFEKLKESVRKKGVEV